MGDSFHKRRKSGGKLTPWRMKRKFELGRQPSETKIGHKRIRTVRTRGGNTKYRALRLDTGNYSWASESMTRKTRLLNVAYNSTNNELVRTDTLVKSGIVQVGAAPFKQWYEQFYGVKVGKRTAKDKDVERSISNHVERKQEASGYPCARQGARAAVQHWPHLRQDRLAPRPVRPLRRLHPRGC